MKKAKVDLNQRMIVKGLRDIGADVQSLAELGRGIPDLLVSYRGVWYVAEVKNGDKSPSRRCLTLAEKAWHERFGTKAPIHTWNSLEDALKTLGLINGEKAA